LKKLKKTSKTTTIRKN